MHQANKKAEFFHSALSTVFDKKGLLLYNPVFDSLEANDRLEVL